MKIEFFPTSKEAETFVLPPEPMKKNIPDWYKKIKSFDKDKMEVSLNSSSVPFVSNSSLKMCAPFLDSLTSGYIQKTWCDIHFEIKNESQLNFYYSHGPEIIKIRDDVSIPISSDYYQIEFLWMTPWAPKMPKGYSCLYTNVSNNFNLPFTNTTGIIDSDNFYHSLGQYPFYLKSGYTGTIPSGTPMYQMFPIKREAWETKINKFDQEEYEKRQYLIKKSFFGQYKKFFWVKKDFS
jgi:hypothetical protein